MDECYHNATAFPFKVCIEKQAEEEFECEDLRAEHGSGKTESEKPETFEHTQEFVEEPELIDKEMLDKQKEVKGDSLIPVNFPAIEMLVPITSCKLM